MVSVYKQQTFNPTVGKSIFILYIFWDQFIYTQSQIGYSIIKHTSSLYQVKIYLF